MSRFRSTVPMLLALLVVTFATSCSFKAGENDGAAERAQETQQARAADEAAIRAASIAWSQAAAARDLDKSMAVYTDDAVQLSAKTPLRKGKDEIRKGWVELFAVPGPGLTFAPTVVQVAQADDLAYEYGTYDFATTDKKGKTADEKGKYVVVWKKQADGSWKAIVDTDNPDQ
jgi:uncharacterized protein (TIGR02246 family)